METTTENSSIFVVDSPLLSAFSRLGSWGSDETYPPMKGSSRTKGVTSFNSMPDFNFPPLFEIYVKQKNDETVLNNSNSATDSNSLRSSDRRSSCKSSSCPIEGGDEDGPHLLRLSSSWSVEEGELTASLRAEDDDTKDRIMHCNKDLVAQVIRSQSPPKGELLGHVNPHSLRKSKDCPSSIIHSFFYPFLNLLRKKVPREKSEQSDLQVPEVVLCSWDLPEGA